MSLSNALNPNALACSGSIGKHNLHFSVLGHHNDHAESIRLLSHHYTWNAGVIMTDGPIHLTSWLEA